jgi:hypothetical protein
VVNYCLHATPTISSTKVGGILLISNKRLYRLFAGIMLNVSIRKPLFSIYRVIALSPISAQYPEAMTSPFLLSPLCSGTLLVMITSILHLPLW